jgi:hypothetical protein
VHGGRLCKHDRVQINRSSNAVVGARFVPYKAFISKQRFIDFPSAGLNIGYIGRPERLSPNDRCTLMPRL